MDNVQVTNLKGVEIALGMGRINVAFHELHAHLGLAHDQTCLMKERHITNGVNAGLAPLTGEAPEDATASGTELEKISKCLYDGLHGFGDPIAAHEQAKQDFEAVIKAAIRD